LEPVAPPDASARADAEARAATLPLPIGSLGRLEELALWFAACRGETTPVPPRTPRVVLFAAGHGIAAAGVSAFGAEETAARVAAEERGDGPVSAFAAVAGATLRVVEVGPVSRRLDREDALSGEEVDAARQRGADVADEEVDAGADLLIPGELGVGISTPTAVLAGAMTGREPVAVVGRGSGIDDTTWMRKTAAVRDGLRRARRTGGAGRDPRSLLAAVGGADLAALTGFLEQSARRRTPVLLDGAPVAVAALLADADTPGAAAWWSAANRDAEPAQLLALEILGLDPLLRVDLRAGRATGALAALPLLTMGVRTLGGSPPGETG